ncbi:hypothetical protein IID22_05195 [Patescibacteria group bacterium]|nr:hypothetical protein [Patescibacteria group bacterium]
MKKFVTALVLGFSLITLIFLPSFVLAENGENSDGHGRFKLQSKNQKFHIHGVVTDISVSGNPATTVTVGPGDHVIILDPSEVDKFNQHGTPEIGGRAKVKGIIVGGSFFAENAHFWPAAGQEEGEEEESEEDNGEPEDEEETDQQSVSLKISDGKFVVSAPVTSASASGLQVLDQNFVIDPGLVDNFEADIEGPPDATAQAEIEGQFGFEGELLIEEITVRPAPLGVVGATILEVINAIFSALASFFSGP